MPASRPPKTTRHTARRQRRLGTAVVEFAVCLPVLTVVVFGSIEVCNAIYLKQTATTAAYEAARISTGTGGTQTMGRLRAEEILAARSIKGSSLVFNPAREVDWKRGSRVIVSVSVPAANNLGGISMFFQSKTLQSTITMVKQ